MPPITINWSDLEIAFERNSPDQESFLDLENGDLLAIIEGEPDAAARRAKVANNAERYLRVDPASSREQYRWMERFVASVSDQALRERLLIAIDGKGAFRRFKDVLLAFPAERERWFTYRSELLHFHIQTWLEHMHIEVANAAAVGHGSNRRRSRPELPRTPPLGRGAGRDPAPAGPRVCWTRSRRPSCPRRWRSSSSSAIAAPARCWPAPPNAPSPRLEADADDLQAAAATRPQSRLDRVPGRSCRRKPRSNRPPPAKRSAARRVARPRSDDSLTPGGVQPRDSQVRPLAAPVALPRRRGGGERRHARELAAAVDGAAGADGRQRAARPRQRRRRRDRGSGGTQIQPSTPGRTRHRAGGSSRRGHTDSR